MAEGTAWRTALGALTALALSAVGVAVVPLLLVPRGPDLDAQVAALPEVATLPDGPRAAPAEAPPGAAEGTLPDDAEARPASPPEVPAPADAPSVAAEPVVPAAPEAELPEEDEALATAETLAPSFDTVRVETDGTGLVAGRAEPGATVSILAGEDIAAEATADADGRFVAFFALSPSGQPRLLSLRDGAGSLSAETVIVAPTADAELVAALDPAQAVPANPPDAPAGEAAQGQGTRPSEPDVEVSEPARPEEVAAPPAATTAVLGSADGDALASAAPDPVANQVPANAGVLALLDPSAASDDAAEPASPGAAPSASAPADDPASVPLDSAEPASEDAAAPADAAAAPEVATLPPAPPTPVASQAPAQDAVLLSDAEGVRVLQPALAPGATPEVLATVALDAIAYDGSGEVVLSGRATDQGAVRLYLDNAPVADAAIGPDGSWTVPLTGTEPGIYTLRVDQLDAQGEVVSRIETPFQREERRSLEAAVAEAGRLANGIALRTVQPGNTLWAIARERYGEPLLYLRVFEANRDRIRNPDLIYPGQVFVLPDLR